VNTIYWRREKFTPKQVKNLLWSLVALTWGQFSLEWFSRILSHFHAVA